MLSETSKLILGIIGNQLEKGDNKGLQEYGVSIDDAENIKYNWNLEAMAEMADALKYQQKEIKFLKQRNRDLRKKTYIKVHEENLKLTEENKKLKNTIDKMREELIKVGQVADSFRRDSIELKEENKQLKGVVESVETFCKQYTTR